MKALIYSLFCTILLSISSSTSNAQFDCDCAPVIDPVCVVDDLGNVYAFPNACLAACANLSVTDINCLGDDQLDFCGCDLEIDPVCIIIGDAIYAFPNACMAECLGYPLVDVDCEWGDTDEVEDEDDENDGDGNDNDGDDNDGDDNDGDDENDGDGNDNDGDDNDGDDENDGDGNDNDGDDNDGGDNDDDGPDVINPYINSLVAYPNPSDGAMQINIDMSTKSKVSVEIISEDGTRLMNEFLPLEVGMNTVHVNTADYEAGLYLYRITITGEDPVIKKFLVQ